MSKPLAKILVTPTMRDNRRERLTHDRWPYHVHIVYKDMLVPWQIPWAFKGLHPLNLNRIRAVGGVKVRAVYLPYWPNTRLGRLAKFLFGWMDL